VLGIAAQVLVMTKNEFPDLQVTAVSWTPANPKVGDEITLSATIKNVGSAASPAGITHGVAFFVDDQFVSWADTFNKSLAPGESVMVASNNGPQGKKSFSITPGTHKVRAVVDDVNRINESDETNNTREIPFAPV
jgi:subtilase family serine protease